MITRAAYAEIHALMEGIRTALHECDESLSLMFAEQTGLSDPDLIDVDVVDLLMDTLRNAE